METRNSCGNVFSDIGFAPDEAANFLFRATLMARLTKITNDRELTEHAPAKLFGITRPRVNLLLNGKIGEFSVDALVNMLGRAGFTVEPRIVQTTTAADLTGSATAIWTQCQTRCKTRFATQAVQYRLRSIPGVSETKLMDCLLRLGNDVQIVVRPARGKAAVGTLTEAFA